MTGTEPVDAFYDNTALGVRAEHGVVLRTRDVTVPHLAGLGRAWQVVYTTRTMRGIPVPASGIVLEPKTRTGNGTARPPLVVYVPTFHGLGGRCAPSQLLVAGTEPDTTSIAAALAQEWTVAVPDGIGLGITGLEPHHFLAAEAGAHAVLDLAMAVTKPAAGSRRRVPVAVWGYADGGRVAVAAAEHQPGYAPELDLRAVAAGAVIRDPRALITALNGGAWAGLAFAGMVGLMRAYSYLPVDHLLTDDGLRAVRHASQLDQSRLMVEYLHPLAVWCERPDPWNDPVWRYVLTNEVIGTKTPLVPVHLYHGLADGLVPVESGRELFAEYTSRDVTVSWSEYDTGHLGAADLGVPDVFTTLREGFTRRSFGREGPLQAT
ncbi:lipase family protein [Nocardia rhizosphaerihabitans]|uniref:lipase family protein n=1 Tax=Nocardia rhizosphaerihabitans TaxID=1691570 RepID=UPI00366E1E7F